MFVPLAHFCFRSNRCAWYPQKKRKKKSIVLELALKPGYWNWKIIEKFESYQKPYPASRVSLAPRIGPLFFCRRPLEKVGVQPHLLCKARKTARIDIETNRINGNVLLVSAGAAAAASLRPKCWPEIFPTGEAFARSLLINTTAASVLIRCSLCLFVLPAAMHFFFFFFPLP